MSQLITTSSPISLTYYTYSNKFYIKGRNKHKPESKSNKKLSSSKLSKSIPSSDTKLKSDIKSKSSSSTISPADKVSILSSSS